jgi:LacI family transcriptional regulator
MAASVVLNGANSSTRVSEKTRERILEAAKRLRYRRNGVALALSRNRMDTVGVVATIDSHDTNVYFLEVLNGILGAAAERGQSAKIFSIASWENEEQRILSFCDGRIDGLIMIGPTFTPTFAGNLAHYTPFVAIHCNGSLPDVLNITVDDEAGGYAATRYLIDQGHRRILHITGTLSISAGKGRLDGYRRALREAGIPFDEGLVLPGFFVIEAGGIAAEELLNRNPLAPLPTAIFCASDAIAYGCMEVLQSSGIRIPEDISVMGFDDTLMARMTIPRMTTIRQPFREMGRRAVELLLSQIHADKEEAKSDTGDEPLTTADRPDLASHSEIFNTEIAIRDSVGPPPAWAVIPAFIGKRSP